MHYINIVKLYAKISKKLFFIFYHLHSVWHRKI